jgi:hypothetical protein
MIDAIRTKRSADKKAFKIAFVLGDSRGGNSFVPKSALLRATV